MRVGAYRLLERVGGGGGGDVYRAVDERSGRTVALKLLRDRLAAAPAPEAPLLHPNVVATLDAGDSEAGPFVAMELLEGADLRRVLARRGRLDATSALAVLVPVLDALAAAHARGLVHGDLKPENVFVARGAGGGATVKLLDLGVGAAPVGPGVVVGTAAYLSPEQACGEPADARSDVFAAGVLLHELLEGSPPFLAPGAVATAYRVVHAPAPVVGHPALAGVLAAALAKDPARRPPHAGALAAALAPLAPDAGLSAAALSALATP